MKLVIEEIYRNMLNKQKRKCAICGKHQRKQRANFAVDHNHITGQIRGLLCSSCNLGIGNLQDSPILLKKAVRYLENGKGRLRLGTRPLKAI